MTLSDSDLRTLWLSVIDEYHATPLAAHYRFHPTSAKFLELRAVVDHVPPGGTLLDIGTGMAIIPRVLKRLGARVISVDPPFVGPEAARNAALAGIETAVCDVTSTPLALPDASIDCILFADVIEHFTHSPRPALREFQRVLKPGGVCIATTPNAVRLPVRLKLLLGYSNWPPISDYYDEPVHSGHHHEYTPAEFRSVFERAGFAIGELRFFGNTGEINKNSFDLASGASASVAKGGNPLVGIGKTGMGLVEKLVPTLRRDMLIVARA